MLPAARRVYLGAFVTPSATTANSRPNRPAADRVKSPVDRDELFVGRMTSSTGRFFPQVFADLEALAFALDPRPSTLDPRPHMVPPLALAACGHACWQPGAAPRRRSLVVGAVALEIP